MNGGSADGGTEPSPATGGLDGGEDATATEACVIRVPPSAGTAVDDTPALQEALDAAAAHEGPCTVELEPAVYDVRSVNPGAAAVNRRALTIAGAQGLTLDGRGATLRLRAELEWQFAKILVVTDSSDVALRGLTLEWSTPATMTGRVTAVGDTWVELAPVEGFSLPDPGPDGRLVRRMWRIAGPALLVDPTSPANFNRTAFPYVTTILDGHYRVEIPESERDGIAAVSIGDEYAIFRSLYTFDAIHVTRTKGIRIEDATIHSVGGIGVWGELSEDIRIAQLQMVPSPEQPKQAFTSTTDGIHLVHNRGTVEIVDSSITRTGDDAINVSDLMMVIADIAEDRTEVTVGFEARRFPPNAGDSLRPSDPEGRVYYRFPVVVTSEPERVGTRFRVSLDRPLNDVVEVGFGLVNMDWKPSEVRIVDNYFYGVRGRGVLLHAQDVDVRRNHFRAITGPGVLLTHRRHVGGYYHGPVGRRVEIAENLFHNAPRSGAWGSVTVLSLYADGRVVEVPGVHRNVYVRDNLFENVPGRGIFARNAFDLWVQRNQFRNVRGAPTVLLEASHEVHALGNCYGTIDESGCRPEGEGSLIVSSDVTGLTSGSNRGFTF